MLKNVKMKISTISFSDTWLFGNAFAKKEKKLQTTIKNNDKNKELPTIFRDKTMDYKLRHIPNNIQPNNSSCKLNFCS